MYDVLVVFSYHYTNWEQSEPNEVEIDDEETDPPRLVGVFTTVQAAADACYTFVFEFDNDADAEVNGGPIQNVVVYGAKIGQAGTGERLCELPLNGNKNAFEAKIRKAMLT